MNTELMNEIASTPGRLDKEALLAKVEDPRFLKWALDPSITFRVIVSESEYSERWEGTDRQPDAPTTSAAWWEAVEELLEQLSIRELTGNAALQRVEAILLHALTLDDCVWACRVINKDLRCNFGVSTVTKVFPGLIEPFACMLAHPYDPAKHTLEGSWTAQAKLDGLRMVVVDGVAYTRTGKVLESVGHILDELAEYTGFVFDGEVMGEGGFDAASGKTRKKGNGPDTSLIYHIFDAIPTDEWQVRETRPLEDRILLIDDLFTKGFKYVKKVEYLPLPANPTFEHVTSLRDSMISGGYEGVMLKDLGAPYCFKRSKDLLKFKFMKDADPVIVDCLIGKGKHAGKLGAFVVDMNGVQSKVGSGFSDAQREEFWVNREEMIGKTVEIAYQDLTADGCFRFPVFVKMRPDRDE